MFSGRHFKFSEGIRLTSVGYLLQSEMEKVKRFKAYIAADALLLVVLVIAGVLWQSTPQTLYP